MQTVWDFKNIRPSLPLSKYLGVYGLKHSKNTLFNTILYF